MKATCPLVAVKKKPFTLTSALPLSSSSSFLFFPSSPLSPFSLFLPGFLFSQAPAAPPPHLRPLQEEKKWKKGRSSGGRNALSECMIDPFSVSLLPFRSCMCQQSRCEKTWSAACRWRSCNNCNSACFSFTYLNWKLTRSPACWVSFMTRSRGPSVHLVCTRRPVLASFFIVCSTSANVLICLPGFSEYTWISI